MALLGVKGWNGEWEGEGEVKEGEEEQGSVREVVVDISLRVSFTPLSREEEWRKEQVFESSLMALHGMFSLLIRWFALVWITCDTLMHLFTPLDERFSLIDLCLVPSLCLNLDSMSSFTLL